MNSFALQPGLRTVHAGIDGSAENRECRGGKFGNRGARIGRLGGVGDRELGSGIEPADDAVVPFRAAPFVFHAQTEHQGQPRGDAPGILDEPTDVGIAEHIVGVVSRYWPMRAGPSERPRRSGRGSRPTVKPSSSRLVNLLVKLKRPFTSPGLPPVRTMIANIESGGDGVGAANMGEVDLAGDEHEVGPGRHGLTQSVVAGDRHDRQRVILAGYLIHVGGQTDVARLEAQWRPRSECCLRGND